MTNRDPGRRGLVLAALPDDVTVMVRLDRAGRPVPALENRFSMPEGTRGWLAGAARTVWARPPSAGGLPGAAPVSRTAALPAADWAVNGLADADMFARGLAWYDAELPQGLAVFNHPRAVARTRRDLVAALLDSVPGLVVPACRRFAATGPDDFARVFEAAGFSFPVLVRPCGQQGGRGLSRIDSASDWAAAADTSWLGGPHFMTAFADSATADGLYLKARVMFVAGRAFVRHVKASRHWKVHNRAEGRVSDDNELAVIDQLEACPVFTAICEAVAARLDLDFCGIDIGVDPDRQRYVLFECNPAMTVFFPERPDMSPAARQRRARLQAPLAQALDHLLRTPSQWVASRRADRLAAVPRVADMLAG